VDPVPDPLLKNLEVPEIEPGTSISVARILITDHRGDLMQNINSK
jgi:hypothetical protein